MLAYGSMRELTDEELARAVRLDPSQIAGLGPSLESLMAMLRERKRKILATYEADSVQETAADVYQETGQAISPPKPLRKQFQAAFQEEQIRELERVWYQPRRRPLSVRPAVGATGRPAGRQVSGRRAGRQIRIHRPTPLTVPEALEVKEELETIDRLLKQLEEAAKTAQIGMIDMEELAEFAEPGDMAQLDALRQQIEDYLRQIAEQQGLERGDRGGYQLTPKAYRLFQGQLLEHIFSQSAWPRAPAGIRGRSSAKERSSCSRPSPTNSATRSPTWTSRRRSSTPCSATGRRFPCG